MNTSELCLAIRDRLRYIFRDMQLPSEGRGDRTSPLVVDSYLPPKRSSSAVVDKQFPFVIVRPSRGSSTQGQNITTIRFIVGVRDLNSDLGVMQALTIKDRLVSELFRAPRMGVFTFENSADWVLFDDQQDPFYELYIDTRWSQFQTAIEGDGDEF